MEECMNIEKIQDLAIKFRDAADRAFEYGAFGQGYPFNNFPHELVYLLIP